MSTKYFSIFFLVCSFFPTVVFANFQKELTLTVGDEVVAVPEEMLTQWQPRTPHLENNFLHKRSVEHPTFCPDHRQPCVLRMSIREFDRVAKTERIIIDSVAIEKYAADLARTYDREPKNATLGVQDGRVITTEPHENGYTLSPTDTAAAIVNALQKNIDTLALTAAEQLADVRTDNLEELGLVELLGEGRSDFSGSPQNRRHNIAIAASRYNNLLVAPGEEFSFVKHLGPVDGAHGFKHELVIKDNQTKPEYGGGICQVSTTVFRAAVLTGMEITQRRNHSYAVKYYEPAGFDATIYLPAPDIRFKNNTGNHILIEPIIDGNEMIVRFYGKNDGRRVTMEGPVVTQRNPDGSMKTYFTQTVVDTNGNVIIDDTFYSNYKSPALYPKPGDISQS